MEVIVRDENIDAAIIKLKKLMMVDGVLIQLRLRSLYPNLTDRARAKALRSISRKKRSERRREAAMQRQRG